MPPQPQIHEGERLREEIARTKLSQVEFARRSGITHKTLQNWFKQPKIKIRMDMLFRLAEALRTLGRDANYALNLPPGGRSVADMVLAGEPIGEPPPSESRRVQWLDGIPIVELSLAAGPWSDVEDVPEAMTMAQIEKGLFGVRLSGDSMQPVYPSGRIVIFQVLREGLDEAEIGKDYYIQREDGSATFKRIVGIGETQVRLAALNVKKYPSEWHVNRVQITRVARAMGKFEPVE
jgi:transcriptional regulator with XRE-family HTH domain